VKSNFCSDYVGAAVGVGVVVAFYAASSAAISTD
jgi:hypothetical protein